MQVRKYRTMTELLADAMEFVKNPYKGKKLKVRLSSSPPGETPRGAGGTDRPPLGPPRGNTNLGAVDQIAAWSLNHY